MALIAHNNTLQSMLDGEIFSCSEAPLQTVYHLAILPSLAQACFEILLKVIQIRAKASSLVIFWPKRYKLNAFS
jgi:hypothetical protein